jgi:hypothetical protein
MMRAVLLALGETAGVLYATALAVVLRGAETLVVRVRRVREERYGQA